MPENKENNSKPKAPKCLISQDVYKTLVQNVSALFLYDDTISLIKQDETFQRVICDYLDAIYTYEDKIKNKDEQLDSLLVAYKTIVGKMYDPIILTKVKIDDLDDKMSFLEIYLRNTLKIELSTILAKFKKDNKKIDPDTLVNIAATASATNIFDELKPNSNSSNNQNDTSNQSSNNQANNESNSNFNAESFLKNNHVNFDQMADAAIATYSKNLLYTRVIKNEFFVFDSKPSFFVWIKWIYLFGMILAAFAFFATFIVNVIQVNGIFVFTSNIPVDLSPKDATNWFVSNSNLIYSNFATVNFFFLLPSILILILIFSNSINIGIKEIKYRNNDNYRFSCSFTPVFFLVIGLMFAYLFPLIQNSTVNPLLWLEKVQANPELTGSYTILLNGVDTVINYDNASVYSHMLAMSILPICLFSFAGLAIICSFGIKLIAPKKNYEVIQNTLLQIASDIKNNRISIEDIQKKTVSLQSWVKNDMRRFL